MKASVFLESLTESLLQNRLLYSIRVHFTNLTVPTILEGLSSHEKWAKSWQYASHISSIDITNVVNSTNIQSATSQKHLGLILNSKLDFNNYTESKTNKFNKVIVLIKNFP